MSRTVMIMAGGTGGHVMPGLAVAQRMRQRGWRVLWMGNPTGMEASLVPKHGIEMRWVRFGGLRGKGWATRLMLPLNLLRAFWQALRALRESRPGVVLGLGGYIAFPGGMMSSLLGIPLVLHEQNSVAGLANRVLARVADRVLVAFPGALPGAQWCGNPVRAEIADVAPPEQRFAGREGALRLLVVGGSLGAQALNEIVPRALALLAPAERPVVTHQSGKAHRAALEANYRQAGVEATLVDFIDDMAAAYAGADLVVCRAGAMTVSELAAAGVASVLVPYPHAVDDHQTGNARFLSERGAALLVPQAELDPQRLADLLRGLTRERLLAMAQRAREAAPPDASARVADVCEAIAKK
ncbi:MAG TPA: undecaprenyldiphospho-muramoylpentapeptide beta-N-acetylglucosaminyltransferase [Quisquiliibacterium sp.]|nr:undecaprenyldiphospho-muramoylpentapeptide beta-N-acetylglucosaminyltransferase [Quisquiliibacterium sp.]